MMRLAVILGLLCALAGAARAEDDLTPDQVSAYVSLVKADQARDRGALDEALQGYREAQARYGAIARKDPRWHPELVQYRLSYCTEEIAALERSEEAPPPPAPAATPPQAAPESPPPAANPAMEKQQREAEQARAALQKENEELRKAQRESAEAIQSLRDELARERAGRAELDKAHERVQASNGRLAEEGRKAEEIIRDLRAQVEGLLADAKKEGGMLRAAEKAGADLAEQCAALSNRLAAVVLAQGESAAELRASEAKRDELNEKLRALRAELREQKAAGEAAEKLRIELETVQNLADTCSRQLASLAQEKVVLQARVSELVQEAQAVGESTDACEETRQALERAQEELQSLRNQSAPAPAVPDDAAPAADVPAAPSAESEMATQVKALSRELEATQKRLEESEKQARDLLREVTFLKRRY